MICWELWELHMRSHHILSVHSVVYFETESEQNILIEQQKQKGKIFINSNEKTKQQLDWLIWSIRMFSLSENVVLLWGCYKHSTIYRVLGILKYWNRTKYMCPTTTTTTTKILQRKRKTVFDLFEMKYQLCCCLFPNCF